MDHPDAHHLPSVFWMGQSHFLLDTHHISVFFFTYVRISMMSIDHRTCFPSLIQKKLWFQIGISTITAISRMVYWHIESTTGAHMEYVQSDCDACIPCKPDLSNFLLVKTCCRHLHGNNLGYLGFFKTRSCETNQQYIILIVGSYFILSHDDQPKNIHCVMHYLRNS